jgi:hypothetical protein
MLKADRELERLRPYETVKPLADSLGLTIEEIEKKDTKGAAYKARHWQGPGNVLICWEHGVLSEILGRIIRDPNPPPYPDKMYVSAIFGVHVSS